MLATPPGFRPHAHRGRRSRPASTSSPRSRSPSTARASARCWPPYEEAQEEEPVRRRRHPAPPPGRLRREPEADPRRRDRRPGHGPRLLEPGGHLGAQAPGRAGATPSTSSATGTTSSGSAATTSSSSTCTTSTSPSGRWARTRSGPSAWAAARCHDEPERGQSYDHFAVDYEFPNGVHVLSMARQIEGCANNVSETIVGTKGHVEQRPVPLHRRDQGPHPRRPQGQPLRPGAHRPAREHHARTSRSTS